MIKKKSLNKAFEKDYFSRNNQIHTVLLNILLLLNKFKLQLAFMIYFFGYTFNIFLSHHFLFLSLKVQGVLTNNPKGGKKEPYVKVTKTISSRWKDLDFAW